MTDDTESSEGETQEFVSIDEASDEDLSAFIAQDNLDDDFEETIPLPEDTKNTAPETSAEAPVQPPAQEDWKAKYEAAEEQRRKLEAHTRQVELWNKRQGNELGDARKKLQTFIEGKKQGLEERILEKPVEGMRDMRQIELAEEKLQQIDQKAAQDEQAYTAYEIVAQNVREEDFDVDAMSACLQADGVSADYIAAFKQNPFVSATGPDLVQLAKRAVRERQLAELVPFTRKLLEENKRLKAKPANVLQQVEKASRQTPSITANNGGATGSRRPAAKTLPQMSDAELKEFIESNRDV